MHSSTDKPWADEAKVHQAEGVLSARLGININEAAGLLRTYADEAQADVSEIALDVLAPLTGALGCDGNQGNAASP